MVMSLPLVEWTPEHSRACSHSSWAALQVMREDIVSAAELGADGVVAGVLTREGEIDMAQLSELLFLCRSLVRTSHSTDGQIPPVLAI